MMNSNLHQHCNPLGPQAYNYVYNQPQLGTYIQWGNTSFHTPSVTQSLPQPIYRQEYFLCSNTHTEGVYNIIYIPLALHSGKHSDSGWG